MGSTKVYETIVARSVEDVILKTISHRAVYNTMKSEGLLKYSKGTPAKKVTRCRYEANYADLIWHTDLHKFNGAYLMAFIDDISRYIVHYEIITSKNAIVTSNVLKRAIEKGNIPFSVWTDNGGEFKAEFQGILIQNNTDSFVMVRQHNRYKRFITFSSSSSFRLGKLLSKLNEIKFFIKNFSMQLNGWDLMAFG